MVYMYFRKHKHVQVVLHVSLKTLLHFVKHKHGDYVKLSPILALRFLDPGRHGNTAPGMAVGLPS